MQEGSKSGAKAALPPPQCEALWNVELVCQLVARSPPCRCCSRRYLAVATATATICVILRTYTKADYVCDCIHSCNHAVRSEQRAAKSRGSRKWLSYRFAGRSQLAFAHGGSTCTCARRPRFAAMRAHSLPPVVPGTPGLACWVVGWAAARLWQPNIGRPGRYVSP